MTTKLITKTKKDHDKWATPPKVYEALDNEFGFDMDPCPIDWAPETHANGLGIPWGTSTFVNPPYSKVSDWYKKAHEEWSLGGKRVVMLVNATTDTIAFHKYVVGSAEVRFVKGRIRFIDPERPGHKLDSNPKPSLIIIFHPK